MWLLLGGHANAWQKAACMLDFTGANFPSLETNCFCPRAPCSVLWSEQTQDRPSQPNPSVFMRLSLHVRAHGWGGLVCVRALTGSKNPGRGTIFFRPVPPASCVGSQRTRGRPSQPNPSFFTRFLLHVRAHGWGRLVCVRALTGSKNPGRGTICFPPVPPTSKKKRMNDPL